MRHDLPIGAHVSACGHVMHADCWRRFFDALLAKETRRGLRFRMIQTSFDISKNEFLCPLCETISNTVLPVMPPLCNLTKDIVGQVEPELSLSDWLDGIQKTVRHSLQQHRDDESQEDSFLFVPCPLSIVTKMMTESVARNFQLLFDYVCDDDASAHFSDSMAEVLRKFCTDVYSTGLGVLPDESNINVPVMTWRACAYTIMSLEHCLRYEEKPLFGGLASPQADCVSALIRLSAVSGHVSTSAIVRQHCVTLLAVLVLESSEHRLHEQQRHNILDIDMFHYLVALCLSLPALYVEEDSGAGVARNQLHIVTGRLNDLHVLHLVLAAHVIQIFLTAFVHMNSKG
jgi:E3 ubiquitin-protein ligase UBR2